MTSGCQLNTSTETSRGLHWETSTRRRCCTFTRCKLTRQRAENEGNSLPAKWRLCHPHADGELADVSYSVNFRAEQCYSSLLMFYFVGGNNFVFFQSQRPVCTACKHKFVVLSATKYWTYGTLFVSLVTVVSSALMYDPLVCTRCISSALLTTRV